MKGDPKIIDMLNEFLFGELIIKDTGIQNYLAEQIH